MRQSVGNHSERPGYDPGRYLSYDPMVALLKHWEATHPGFLKLSSLGRTLEGREIWLATVTDFSTGGAEEKPASWVDGNTHAGEVTGTQACLHLLHRLLEGASDPSSREARLLQSHTFYVVPRIAADGAELYLNSPHSLRSTPALWPEQEELPGLYPEDLDGDGEILLMLVPDSGGAWRKSRQDSRVLVYRAPDELPDALAEEPSYRVYREGRLRQFDGFDIRPRMPWGLDLNRQYPAGWKPESKQPGAGTHPLSQPESRAIVEALVARPNVSVLQSFHTYSGAILRPSCSKPDSDLPRLDLEAYRHLGRRGTELTDYPCLSVYEDFRYDPKDDIGGGFIEWAYEHRGILSFSTELWSAPKAAGIEVDSFIEWFFRGPREDEQVRLLRWCDATLPSGSYFSDWKTFDHPELGPVELGGFKLKRFYQNPPEGRWLEQEVARNVEFVLACAAAAPRLEWLSATEERLGRSDEGRPLRRLQVAFRNLGFLSSNGTEKATALGVVPPTRVELLLSAGLQLRLGSAFQEAPVLSGRVLQTPYLNTVQNQQGVPTSDRHRIEWLVEGEGPVTVKVRSPRGGTLTRTFPG
jgi:murein tripeptide amidase MpaA